MADSLRLRLGNFQGPLAVGGVSNVTLNGSGVGLAWIVDARTTSAISKIRFRYGARTGTPPTYSLRLEGVDTSGNPDGVDRGGGSPTAVTFTPPASTAWDGLTQEVTLTNPYTPSSNSEVIAITIRHSSGTVDASNCSSFTSHYASVVSGTRGFPFHSTLSAGTWTKQTVVGIPNVAWITASRTFGFVKQSTYSTTQNTSGRRSAAMVTLPASIASTTTITGVHLIGQFAGASASFVLGIWDASNNLIASRTIDADQTTGLGTFRAGLFEFASPIVLTNGSKYYIGLESVSSSTVGVQGIVFASTADMQGLPNGDNVGIATYNGTAWTENANIYPLIELVTSDISPPSASGGAILIGGLGQTGIGAF